MRHNFLHDCAIQYETVRYKVAESISNIQKNLPKVKSCYTVYRWQNISYK